MRSYFWCLYYSNNLLFFKHVSCCKFLLYASQWQRISFVFCWYLELLRYISNFEMNFALTLMHRCPLTYSLATFDQLVHKPCRERKLIRLKLEIQNPKIIRVLEQKLYFKGNTFSTRSHRAYTAVEWLSHN